ncbi:MAG: hypothetical protein ACRCSP_00160, partial [Rhodoglobus sp.]
LQFGKTLSENGGFPRNNISVGTSLQELCAPTGATSKRAKPDGKKAMKYGLYSAVLTRSSQLIEISL